MLLRLRSSLSLLLLRRRLTLLLLLWWSLALLLLWRRLTLLLLDGLVLLLLLNGLVLLLLLLLGRLMLLLLLYRLMLLLLLLNCLVLLLLLLGRLMLLLLLYRLMLLLLLLLLLGRLLLLLMLLLRGGLMLRGLRSNLAVLLLLLRRERVLLLLRRQLAMLRSRSHWSLLVGNRSAWFIPIGLALTRLVSVQLVFSRLIPGRFIAVDWLRGILRPLSLAALLRSFLIARLQSRRSSHVVVCRKRLADREAGRTAMIHTGKLSPIGAGGALILELRRHGRGMRRMQRRQFCGSRTHLHSARSAVEADASAAPAATPVVAADRAAINVALDGDVYVVDGAVVVEVAATPVTALIAEADIPEPVVDAAIEAHVLAPVAAVEPVVVMPVAPVARRPQSALVGSLDPHAGHPIIVSLRPGPVAGGPEIIVAGRLRLVVVGQRWRRLVGGIHWLLAVSGVLLRLIRLLAIIAAPIRRRSALLAVVTYLQRRALLIAVLLGRLCARICGCGGHVGRSRVRGRVLCTVLASASRDLVLIRFAANRAKHCRQQEQRQSSKLGKYAHFTLQYA